MVTDRPKYTEPQSMTAYRLAKVGDQLLEFRNVLDVLVVNLEHEELFYVDTQQALDKAKLLLKGE